MLSARQKLIRKLRRQVRVHRRFDVEYLDGSKEKHTCRECHTSEIIEHERVAPELAKKLAAYRSRGGVTGICKHCSRQQALERYPD